MDKEADLVITFKELSVLLPGKPINLFMVGPLISPSASGRCMTVGLLSVTLFSLTLQDYLQFNPSPDLVICLNAGLSAYSSWKYAVEKLAETPKIKCYITDYCLLSLEASQKSLTRYGVSDLDINLSSMSLTSSSEVTAGAQKTPPATRCPHLLEPTLNPFRDPKKKLCDSSKIPWFSNAFISELVFL